MLSFDLRAHGRGAGWRATPAGFTSGNDRVEPLRHPALEEVVLTCGRRLVVCVRERGRGLVRPEAGSGVPVGRLTPVSAEQFERLARTLREWPLQWQQLMVEGETLTNGTPRRATPLATVRAGGWGSAPLFATTRGDELHGHWDPARLFAHAGPADPDPALVSRFLTDFETPYAHRLLLPDIRLVTERSQLTWRSGQRGNLVAEIEYPPPIDRPLPGELMPGADVIGGFEAILSSSLRRWAALGGSSTGSELSGGLDSGLVTATAAMLADRPLRSYGIGLMGTCAEDQRGRRLELCRTFGLEDTEVLIGKLLPLAAGTCRVNGDVPVVPWEECYYEATDGLLRAAAAQGTRVMLTGFGGDELCGLRPSELAVRRSRLSGVEDPGARRPHKRSLGPGFLTSDARATLSQAPDRAPAGPSSDSALEASALGSAMYLRRGIWPIHPLCTPELVNFCGRLPAPWRTRRAIQRRLLGRLGASTRVTAPRKRDDFSPALVTSLRTLARPGIRRLFGESRLAALGIVDAARLQRTYDLWCQDGSDEGAVPLYATAVTELALARLR
jgi:asparagine synthase (glutamine-hydrolysing)